MLHRIFNPHIFTNLADCFCSIVRTKNIIGEIDPYHVKKVLVVKLDGIGDMILASPLLRELRANLPEAFITLMVSPHIYNLVELCPHVNEIIPFSWEATGRWGDLKRFGRILWLSMLRLRRQQFDLALVPHWEADWYGASLIAYCSGASRRVGYSEKVTEGRKVFNKGFDNYYTDAIYDPSLKHEVERNLFLLNYAGLKVNGTHLECWTSPHDEAAAKNILQKVSAPGEDKVVAFGIGANHPNRKWPLDNFSQMGSWLINTYQARIVLVGGHQDRDDGQELQRRLGSGAINTAGLFSLRQTAALMKYSVLYLGNDTGPMHLAAANKVPVIEISCHPLKGNPSHVFSPKRFGPWGVPHIVLQPATHLAAGSQECRASEAHCITNITLDEVKAACRKMIEVLPCQKKIN